MKTAKVPSARHSQPDHSEAPVSSDETLLELIADGDQAAMAALFARHNVRVFRFALAITKDRSVAEDILGEVFLHVWRSPRSFGGRSKVTTWILAIARNKALSAQRYARDHSTEELEDTIEDTSDTPEAATERSQAMAILGNCIQKLPAIHREIINLVYYHQKSIAETAEIMDVPQNTVKSRMFYARKRLADIVVDTVNVALIVGGVSGRRGNPPLFSRNGTARISLAG